MPAALQPVFLFQRAACRLAAINAICRSKSVHQWSWIIHFRNRTPLGPHHVACTSAFADEGGLNALRVLQWFCQRQLGTYKSINRSLRRIFELCLDESPQFVHSLDSIILYLPSLGIPSGSISRAEPPARILKFCHRLWHRWRRSGMRLFNTLRISVWRMIRVHIFADTPSIHDLRLIWHATGYVWSSGAGHEGRWTWLESVFFGCLRSLWNVTPDIPTMTVSPVARPSSSSSSWFILITILIITRVSLRITVFRNQYCHWNDS